MMVKPKDSLSNMGRYVRCTHCEGDIQVGRRAMSVFCPHCKKRVILENFKIKAYLGSRSFATCGDLLVEKSGFVSAPIRVTNMTIKGRVKGNIKARGCVTIARTAEMRGDISAPRLVVSSGAKMDGFCRITPDGTTPCCRRSS